MKKVLCAIVIACSVNVNAQVFSTPVPIDNVNLGVGDCGPYTSICLLNSYPACAFYDSTHGDLHYAKATIWNSGQVWGNSIIVDGVNNVGKYCSIALVNGFPAIAYADVTYNRLLFVRALDPNGFSWGNPIIVEDIPGEKPVYCSLKIVNGRPAISFAENNSRNLKYVIAQDANGTTWANSTTVQSTGFVGSNCQLTIVHGHPAITYSNETSGQISFCRATDSLGTTWGGPIALGSTGDSGYYLSCSFTAGRPAVSYYDANTTSLKFTIATDSFGATWASPITLDNGPNVGRYVSMMSLNGRLAIVYENNAGGCAKFIRCLDTLGNVWSTPIQASNSNIGCRAICAQSVFGKPFFLHINNFTGSGLVNAYCPDSLGSQWFQTHNFWIPDPSGLHLSLGTLANKPISASCNNRINQLVYVLATDSCGQHWNANNTIAPMNSGGGYTSINQFFGHPAIAYTRNGNTSLYYIRAYGANWLPATKIDSTSFTQDCQLINLNGRPAIIYHDGWTQRIKFAVATDSLGSTWTPHVIPVNSNVTNWFDVIIVNGRPGIAYVDNGGLKYIYALDSSGQSWSAPTTVTADCGQPTPALAEVNGVPAISYQDGSTYLLHYCKANNAAGSSWSAPIATSVSAYGAFECDMVVSNNRPVIAFTKNYSDVYCIIADDTSGATWGTEFLIDSLYGFVQFPGISLITIEDKIGIGYYREADNYAYYVDGCIPPLSPNSISANLCPNETATLQASGYGNLSWYTASSGGTYLGSGSSFSTPALTNTTTYYVQDSTCAASTRTAVTVIVNPLPTISISGNTQLCTGDSTTLSVSGNGDGFEWSTGSMNMSESFVPTSSTNYWVMTYDGAGCVDTIFFSINVTPAQTTTQTIPLCDGDSYSIGNSTYSAAGTYTDTLATVQAGCDSVVVTTITIQPSIDTTVTYSQGVLSSNESGATYQWINCTTQLPVNGATNQNFTSTQNGTYAAIISAGPCTDTSECFNVTDVGIVDFNVATWEFTVAPNPSSGQFTITTTGTNAASEFEIVNTLGQIVKTVTKANSATITVQLDVPGVYFVLARSGSDVKSAKIIVE